MLRTKDGERKRTLGTSRNFFIRRRFRDCGFRRALWRLRKHEL